MSVAEIRFRSKQKIRIEMEKLRSRISRNGSGALVFFRKEIKNVSNVMDEFPHQDIQFFGLSGDTSKDREIYQEIFPSNFSKAINDADNLLRHRFHFLGEDFILPDPIDWNRNPATDNPYPKQHYSTIRTGETDTYGDIKYLWELNRHQFFIELGKAYFLTGDEKYATKIRDWITDWIICNPYKLTVNWTSALESSMRIFSWVWTFYFTRDSGIWSSDFKMKFLRNLLLEGAYIEENLSYYFSPYNHLIGELAALTFLGTIFGTSKKMISWRDKYWMELENQVNKQFHRDGFTVEQASYYHHYTLGFYLMTAILRKQNDLPVSANIWERLEKALEISMHLTRSDGRMPMIGDIDNARSVYFYQPQDMWNLRLFLAVGTVLFDRVDMKYVAREPFEEILWLLGSRGLEKFEQLKQEKPNALSKSFPESGYFVMRDGWDKDSNYLYFDCGEIAHGVHQDSTPSAAHGHADILSFELTIDGKPVIIDPGFHNYFGPLEWHRYFRSTQAHNSITVNDCEQAQHKGRISWSRVSSPQLIAWFSSSHLDFVGGAIDRFANLEESIFHRRYILNLKPYCFLVMDEISSAKEIGQEFKVSSFLHFSEGDLQLEDFSVYRDGEKVGVFSVMPETKIKMEVGLDQPHQGWTAPGYGYRVPAPVIELETQSQLPVKMGMLFPIKYVRENLVSFTSSEHRDGITRYEIETKDWQEIIFLNPSKKMLEMEEVQSIQTDALCLALKGDHHTIHELNAIQLSNFDLDDNEIINKELSGLHLDFDKKDEYSASEWK